MTLTKDGAYDIIRITLCTAYKSTVQTEQTVIIVMESGHLSDSGIYTHGTVVANTGCGCFYIVKNL